ncbi:rRNA maturation RNase YbeY [Thiohalobacter sp. IOR34]|uniref:rRNA maturation RNase YbeY n=1 Tax=Thiohalobacter sp. IOR34 TaxID=3057176 RepID=UPI0025AF1224|nr:rRNA maturation RNase YbeY [Thiohalobacter sp. IOR34]WJW74890.1 rRNA maturation RNase YbeY [Thiohalobacter sp. IOR34]
MAEPQPAGGGLRVELQHAQQVAAVPDDAALRRWAQAAWLHPGRAAEVTVRIVDAAESAELNRTYRHREGPTNVLSFPFEAPPGVELPLLGDLVICAPVVARQAAGQGKTLEAHWAHMLVHGMLHLQGYDHMTAEEAGRMEGLECEILARLGYANPYEQ